MNEAIGMLNAGKSATVVLRHLGYTRKSIVRLQRRFSVTGKVADRPRSGRQPVTPSADDRYIVLQHLRNRSCNRKTVWYSSTDCQKSVETERSTNSCVPTVLRSNSHPTSSNRKVGLVPPSPALPTCWFGVEFVFR